MRNLYKQLAMVGGGEQQVAWNIGESAWRREEGRGIKESKDSMSKPEILIISVTCNLLKEF